MIKYLLLPVLAGIFLAAVSPAAPAFCADAYRITLKSGETITAKYYEIQEGNIVLYKLGGSFTFSREDVIRIEKETMEAGAAPAAPEQTAVEKTSRKSGKKGTTSKDAGETELAKCQRILKLHQNSMEIQCSQAASAQISAAPNLPKANVTTVSEKTARQFQEHVQSKVSAYKAGSSCDFYKRKVAELEKKCNELQ
jgi:hypothetical protein